MRNVRREHQVAAEVARVEPREREAVAVAGERRVATGLVWVGPARVRERRARLARCRERVAERVVQRRQREPAALI